MAFHAVWPITQSGRRYPASGWMPQSRDCGHAAWKTERPRSTARQGVTLRTSRPVWLGCVARRTDGRSSYQKRGAICWIDPVATTWVVWMNVGIHRASAGREHMDTQAARARMQLPPYISIHRHIGELDGQHYSLHTPMVFLAMPCSLEISAHAPRRHAMPCPC